MSRFIIDQEDDGLWYIFDNESCYCAGGPFKDEFVASNEKSRLEELEGISNE